MATVEDLADSADAAVDPAGFLAALQAIAPCAGDEGLPRRSLADRDGATRAATSEADGTFDAAAMTELWDAAQTGRRITEALIGWGLPSGSRRPREPGPTPTRGPEDTAVPTPLPGMGPTPGSGRRTGADRTQKVTSEQA